MAKFSINQSKGSYFSLKRIAWIVTMTLFGGIAIGVGGTHALNAHSTQQQEPVKRKLLLHADLADNPGKEATLGLSEYAPGANSGKHYHPRHYLIYVMEGSAINEEEGKPPVTFKEGDVFYEPPNLAHSWKNASTTAPLRLLSCGIGEKGQPSFVPVR